MLTRKQLKDVTRIILSDSSPHRRFEGIQSSTRTFTISNGKVVESSPNMRVGKKIPLKWL